jgi:hypothetical protein
MNAKYVVVTTDKDKRGVFMGRLEKKNADKGTCVLSDARMCVYWSAETHGVLGLASDGPQKGSRITPSVPRIELTGVTSFIDCTEKAVTQWQTLIWE